MRIGVACLYYEIDKVLNIIEKNKDFINHIEIGIDTANQIDEIAPFIDKIKELGLSIGIHLAMEINTSENIEFIRENWAKFCFEMCKSLEKFNPSYFNIHMGYAIKNRFLKNNCKYMKNSVDFFLKLSDYLEKLSIKPIVTVENSYNLIKGDVINTGTTKEEFKYIFENTKEIRLKNKSPYFCFDTGHYILNKDDYFSLKDLTKVVHISDCNGEEDNHLGIFCGRLKKVDLKKAIDMNPDYAVIEVKYDYIEESIKNVKDFFKPK